MRGDQVTVGRDRMALRLSAPLVFIGGAVLLVYPFLADMQMLYVFLSPQSLVAFVLGIISIFLAAVLQVRNGKKIALSAAVIIVGAICFSLTRWINNSGDLVENPFFLSSLLLFAGGAMAWAWDA